MLVDGEISAGAWLAGLLRTVSLAARSAFTLLKDPAFGPNTPSC